MSFFRRYLQSTGGRVCIIGSALSVAIQLLPNSIGLSKVEGFWTVRSRGQPMTLPFDVLLKFKQVMEDMKLPSNMQSLIKAFNIDAFDLFYAGTPNGQLGGIVIGIPGHYSYNNITSFNNKFIMVQRKQVDWEKRDAKRLLESLLLSDEAQKFSIASGIMRVQSGELYYDIFGLAAAILMQPIAYEFVKNKFGLDKATIRRRTIAMVATSVVLMCFYLLYKDTVARMVDKMVDTAVSEIGPEYVMGGQQFYRQLLGRNLALRSIMAEDGDYYYTSRGDAKSYVRYNTVPTSERLQYFNEKCKNMQSQPSSA